MRLSVRTRVLAAYGVLITLFFIILFTGHQRLQRMGANLNMIQAGYMPIVKTVNSFFNLFHLDESFDVSKILDNRSNRLFIESISIHNPQLLESGLQRGLKDARQALQLNPSLNEYHALDQIAVLTEKIIQPHSEYRALIQEILVDVRRGNFKAAQDKNEELLRAKRMVRSRINVLSRRVDDRIRNLIHGTVTQERNAVYLTLIWSVVTLILALFIGLIAILSLRPLSLLKKAAREIAAGDLQQRVEIRSRDEVGDLGQEFNRMADAIEDRDQMLRKQQEQLLQSERMAVIGRMASKISHEVRNPLNALSLNVELLTDEITEEPLRKPLMGITKEIERLNTIVENYLNLARPSKQSSEEADLGALLTHLVTFIQPECRQRKLNFSTDFPPHLPKVRADVIRLEQAFLNLMQNSMDALKQGGSFGIKATQDASSVTLEFWDQGCGIPSDQLQKIFEPFFTTKEKGTGLGLAITNEVIREEGGTLECQSTVGQGTTFTLTFPLSADTNQT